MKQPVIQDQESVILEYPYKPFGWLTVTSERLVFKKLPLWVNTFSGTIPLSELRNVRLIKEKALFSLFAEFWLEFAYVDPKSKSVKLTTIHLPGFATRIGMERRGVTPESLHRAIVELLETREDA